MEKHILIVLCHLFRVMLCRVNPNKIMSCICIRVVFVSTQIVEAEDLLGPQTAI